MNYLSRQSAGARNVSPFELTRVKMEAVGTAIERAQALGNYYLAYYRVLNSIGVESLNKETLADIKKRMEVNLAEMQKEEGKNKETISSELDSKKAELIPVQNEIDSLKKTIAALENEMNLTQTGMLSLDRINKNIEEAQKNLSLAQNENKELESALENLNSRYDEADSKFAIDIDNAPEESKASLEEQRALARQKYEKESAALREQIEDSSYKVTDSEKALESVHATLEDSTSANEKIADYKEELASYTDKLGKLDEQKAELDSQITELEKKKADTENEVSNYVLDIKKYEDAMNVMASDKSYESTMNLEMTQNLTGNLVTPEEYAPTAGDIQIETQKDAGDNVIDEDEYQNVPSPGITEESLYNLDMDEPNVQQLNFPQAERTQEQFDDMPGNLGFDIRQNQPDGRIEN